MKINAWNWHGHLVKFQKQDQDPQRTKNVGCWKGFASDWWISKQIGKFYFQMVLLIPWWSNHSHVSSGSSVRVSLPFFSSWLIQWDFIGYQLRTEKKLKKVQLISLFFITWANRFLYWNSYSPGLCLGMKWLARAKTCFNSPKSKRTFPRFHLPWL